MERVCARLAPSPTGFAHLGNAWAFLMAWLAARAQGGEVVLRMEDLDLERSSVVAMQMIMADMRWLGLDWDRGPTPEKEDPLYHQSNRSGFYRDAIAQLRAQGMAYPCFCSRKEVRLASAPHLGDAGAPYPGTCRHLAPEDVAARIARGDKYSWRFRSDGRTYAFVDQVYGPQASTLEACGGDFNMQRSDGVFSYQLAVAVDDGLMGINQVVRGRDILPSTPRQMAILDALGYPEPAYAHIPLLLDEYGERLAKRHASLSLDTLRGNGVTAPRIVGWLAFVAGFLDRPQPARPAELVSLFDFRRIRRDDYRLTARDMSWLFGKEYRHG